MRVKRADVVGYSRDAGGHTRTHPSGKDIPGFMAAMTMPYPVLDDQTLNRVKPEDEITADVVAKDSDIHIDNVVVVKKAGTKK
jgi:Cu/Ag efflux protein CusF